MQAEALALEKKQDYDTSVLKESAKSAMDAIKCERDDIKLKYVQHVERTKVQSRLLYIFKFFRDSRMICNDCKGCWQKVIVV